MLKYQILDKLTFNKEIGKQILKIRKDRGLSQVEFGLICKKSKQNINRLEKGLINPSLFYIYELSTALNVKISDIIDT